MKKIIITGLILGSIFMIGCSNVKEEVSNKTEYKNKQVETVLYYKTIPVKITEIKKT